MRNNGQVCRKIPFGNKPNVEFNECRDMKKLMLIFGVLLVFSMSLFAQQTLVQTSGCLNGNTNNGVTTLSCGDEIEQP